VPDMNLYGPDFSDSREPEISFLWF